ncbi:MAG: hypothetical protein COA32_14545 [Fluviicola sp.]|nr:MAG: hypothetical protein COA32_14545 [Fluviicola sp.]
MKSQNLKYLVNNSSSKLIAWKDESHFEKTGNGLKKKEIERQEVHEMLTSIDAGLILEYKSNGAPFTSNSIYTHISISHYGGHYAIYLSNKPVGVDIQVFKSSLAKGKHYFVNEAEESSIELSKINLHLIWTAKEAFYKMHSGEIPDLKNEVSIKKIDESDKSIALNYAHADFLLNYLIFENHLLTWT